MQEAHLTAETVDLCPEDADMELLGLHYPGEGRKILPSRPSGETPRPLAPLGKPGGEHVGAVMR